jgi:predicted GIY-YIG superfamily endonuclease
MYFVYQRKCSNGSRYTGCTNNLDARLDRHSKGYVFSTKDKLPIELEMYVAFTDKYKAFAFEKYLKSGSGRAFAKRHF